MSTPKIPRLTAPSERSPSKNASFGSKNNYITFVSAGLQDGICWHLTSDGILTWWRESEGVHTSTSLRCESNAIAGFVGVSFGFVTVKPQEGIVSLMDLNGDVRPEFVVSLPLQDGMSETITATETSLGQNGAIVFAGTSLGNLFVVSYQVSAEPHVTQVNSLIDTPVSTSNTSSSSWFGGLLGRKTATNNTSNNNPPLRRLENPIPGLLIAHLGSDRVAVLRDSNILFKFKSENGNILGATWGATSSTSRECLHLLVQDKDSGDMFIQAIDRGVLVAEVGGLFDMSEGITFGSFLSLSVLDDEYHVFFSNARLVKQCDVDVKTPISTDCTIPGEVIAAGGGDAQRAVWYYTPSEGFCYRRARKALRAASPGALGVTSLGTLSPEARERYASRVQSVGYDSLDGVVLQVSRDIVTELRVHHGNWNRPDLGTEDQQLVSHISTHLATRSASWNEFYLFLVQSNLWQPLRDETKSEVIRHKETLCILQQLREMQNSVNLTDVINFSVANLEAQQEAFVSNSERFYSNVHAPLILFKVLSSHNWEGEIIPRCVSAFLQGINTSRGLLPPSRWTSDRSFVDAFSPVLLTMSETIALLDRKSRGGGPQEDWSRSTAVTPAIEALKDLMTTTLLDGTAFALTEFDQSIRAPLLQSLYLRNPFFNTPVGYPHGPLILTEDTPFSRKWAEQAQTLAEQHNVYPVLLAMIASCPPNAPEDILRRQYQRLSDYIERLPGFLEHLVFVWQRDGRGYDFVSLSTNLLSPAKELFNKYVTEEPNVVEPKYRWLLNPQAATPNNICDAALQSTNITHRAALLSLAKFANKATKSNNHSKAAQDIAAQLQLVRAQQKFFPTGPAMDMHEVIRALSHENQEGVLVAASLAQHIVEMERRHTVLEALVRRACVLDVNSGIVKCVSRGSDASERQQQEALNASTVVLMSRKIPVVREWLHGNAGGTHHLKDLQGTLTVLAAAERSYGMK